MICIISLKKLRYRLYIYPAKEAAEAGDFRSYSQLFEDGAKKILQERRVEKSENPIEVPA